MNRIFLAAILFLTISGLQAQNRKYISNFSAFQHYYNPALTGNEGSMVRTYYRNQWTGFEDAPKTLFFSGELDLADLNKTTDKTSHYQFRDSRSNYMGAQHAFGLIALQERFGPTRETQLGLNYGTGVRLSQSLSLRFGTSLTFNNFRLDGNSLVVDNTGDPRFQHVLNNQNSMSKFDLNLGFALASANYYLGYAMQDITRGHFLKGGDNFMKDVYTRKHLLQAGFRASLAEPFGLIVNGLYQYDEQLKGTVEGQAKVVYDELLWLGAGYRNDQAFHVAAGLHYRQFRITYAYESPIKEARSISRSTNEIGLAYTFRQLPTVRTGSSRPSFW
ncbi:PorP/SprF family type IX secretion system membrane protein [Pontibacter indicus]|uniref:Type IX secretion system membrane protein, PorP/SprF family n=1 Tax=Pontibacter indicus TaxID=1317125 RepID=A0A1R3WIJ8_9BACT|nr:PorP/SprF family type IX secretion system membrane protein [Pontibacter indicus]SIT77757.1 type IX secretion system membrane protein, PorP/SprF family [Pontibacter indicus]